MERKATPLFDAQVVNESEGIVDHLFSVFGVIDEGGDRVHPGAFLKTTRENLGRIKVLDSHNARSILSVLGKPLEFFELSRDQLPQHVLDRYPEATGGMVARVRYFLDTPEGNGAFVRIKEGGVTESSFGYDVIRKDYTEEKTKDGRPVRVRELRELRLYDVSPVIFGMNPATTVLAAKADEAKRWQIVREHGQFCVYRSDGDGVQGDPLKCYDSEEDAQAYLAALYANMPEEEMSEEKAVWTTEYINDLPDSAFLYIEPGHEKDEEGKTVPRSARHFPYRNAEGEIDLPHLRNAIARIPQSNAPGLDERKKEQLQERARRLLEEATGGKQWAELCMEVKALRETIQALIGVLRPENIAGAEPGHGPPLTPEERISRIVNLLLEMKQ